ncbi:hypothetical protein D9O36_13885 [Zobellia amurskyensis]|uniref:Uncharacterized protein n=1 Tax=Zobellia amurskyensis TaxID=248905 RepID=A0A7X2ZV53_9FLAO|nr:hypothetical protein [Zobellia amurskyensis]MUH36939.1 hypothetical protein [Zobellia amurskyensis]
MTTSRLLSIVYGAFVWILGVSVYLLSFSFPLLDNVELQSSIALFLGIIPSACLGTYLFYKKGRMRPCVLALTFVLIATILDIFITVPVFIIPTGGSYATFFGDPMFFIIIVEFFFTVVYFRKYTLQKTAS